MSDKKVILALGFFDSLHLGHKKVISKTVELAKENNAKSVVFTFKGDLRSFINNKEEELCFLNHERENLIKSLGADEVFFAPVTKEFLSLSGNEFLDFINKQFDISGYVLGGDFTFGQNALNNVNDIILYAKRNNQFIKVIDILFFNGRKISSTDIKEYLKNGEIEKANALLSFPFFVSGKVFSDRKIGRTLGFPTANIVIDKKKVKLKDGVYKGYVYLENKKYLSIINYGSRPTFNLNEKLIEVHILNFSGDLYNKDLTVYFEKFIRQIKKFNNKDELIKQLIKDKNYVLEDKND